MEKVIEVKNLTVRLNDIPLLGDVSFDIKKGEIVAIIGPNGAGKTTLIRALLGLTPITSGQVKILGKRLPEVRTRVSYVPQKFQFDKSFPITVREFLQLSYPHTQGNQEKTIASRLMHVEMEKKMDTLLGNLSGGELQRVLIEKATLNNPDILFLDEPASGIDMSGETAFYEIIQHLNHEHHTTVVMVSHEIDLVYQYATQVVCLNRGLVCYGKPADVLSAGNLKQLFGEKVAPHVHQ